MQNMDLRDGESPSAKSTNASMIAHRASLESTNQLSVHTPHTDASSSLQSRSTTPLPAYTTTLVRDFAPDSTVIKTTTIAGSNSIATSRESSSLPGNVCDGGSKHKDGEWSHDICASGRDPNCCQCYWCPCIVYARVEYRLDEKVGNRDPLSLDRFDTKNNGDCWMYALTGNLCGTGLMTAMQRARIRKMYGIKGSFTNDLLLSFFCRCCTVLQNEREIIHREGAKPMEGYRTQPNMVYVLPSVQQGELSVEI